MSPTVPLVEDRIRHMVAVLDSLHRLAAFSSQPHDIPLFAGLPAFADTVVSFTRAVRLHLDALTVALPETCRSIAAPGQDAAALPPSDRVIYLHKPERDIFYRLDNEARAFGVLAHALGHYVSDLRHFDGQTLSDMAALVRAEGRSTLQSADEIEAVARRIQEETANEEAQALRRELEARSGSQAAPDEKGGAR